MAEKSSKGKGKEKQVPKQVTDVQLLAEASSSEDWDLKEITASNTTNIEAMLVLLPDSLGLEPKRPQQKFSPSASGYNSGLVGWNNLCPSRGTFTPQ